MISSEPIFETSSIKPYLNSLEIKFYDNLGICTGKTWLKHESECQKINGDKLAKNTGSSLLFTVQIRNILNLNKRQVLHKQNATLFTKNKKIVMIISDQLV